jgi:hypothetical protein
LFVLALHDDVTVEDEVAQVFAFVFLEFGGAPLFGKELYN